MPKETVFTMKLEPELRKDFIEAADAVHRPASQIVRELMREFIRRQQSEAQEYEEFLRDKVAVARMQIRTEQSRSNEEIEQKFAKQRGEILQAAGDTEW
jgi:predicted transcriptional regulator